MKWFQTNFQNTAVKNIIIINNRGESIITGIEICAYQTLEVIVEINLVNQFMFSGGIERYRSRHLPAQS